MEEEVVLRRRFGFLAFHGGSLEQGTDAIAEAAAAASDASFYAIRQPEDFRHHLPSAEIDPAASPKLRSFLDHVEVAIAIHGYGRPGEWMTILAGGTNRALARAIAAAVEAELPDYAVVADLAAIPVELRGLHPDNPVNRPQLGGVQLELPPRVRGMGPFWADHPSRAAGTPSPHTTSLVAALAAVAKAWVPPA